MTISVNGIGWFIKEDYGCVRSGFQQAFGNGEGLSSLPKKDIFSHPFKNFGRLDNISKSTVFAVALALRDASVEYSRVRKQDIGILGTNTGGSLRTDIEYFRDYIDSGRTLSRGNLFIYTLPSSPLGEAAIHFGFLGPLLYAAAGDHSLAGLMEMASEMIHGGETSMMLAGKAEDDEAVFFVIGKEAGPGQSSLCTLSEARSTAKANSGIAGMIRDFSFLAKEKARS